MVTRVDCDQVRFAHRRLQKLVPIDENRGARKTTICRATSHGGTSMENHHQRGADIPGSPVVLRAAGFWRRLIAFLVDSLVLGAIGSTLAIFFIGPLSQMGEWGRLIGFAIGSAYFSYFEGGRPVGQSPGKRLMKIKVIRYGRAGGSLTRPGAWLRYVVIAVPTVLIGLAFIDIPSAHPVDYASTPLIWKLNGFVIFLWTFALGYLMIFNRRDRRSLQDFATSSVVVPVAVSGIAPQPMAERHWAAMAVGAVALGAGCMALNHWVEHLLVPYGEPIQRAMSTVKGVRYSGVTVTNVRTAQRAFQQTMIMVGTTDPGLVSEDGVRQIANLAFRAAPELATQQFVAVVCQQRATLGIGSWTRGYSRALTPQQWATQAGVVVPGTGHG